VGVVIVTGSGGLVGSACVRRFVEDGHDVVGLDNDMRARFFGPSASTARITERLRAAHPREFHPRDVDVRDADAVDRVIAGAGRALELVVHAAAQPSHDWAASDPATDFSVNALATLNLLEALRHRRPDATFVFCSTNKVYGDRPNALPLVEGETRLDLPVGHPYHDGITIDMSIDRTLHSLFGVSKAAADLLVQEYGRYFGMPTACFRAGCLTGPGHQGAELHGFLSYLMRCVVAGEPYTVFGYGGKQVRDNLHADDVASAFAAFHASPRTSAVYNLGGGRSNAISMLEAIGACERIAGRPLSWTLSDRARTGDHRWWISDLDGFRRDHPGWELAYDLERTLREIHDTNVDHWSAGAAGPAAVSERI